ncbi:MAG: glycosyltransferase family 87 protein [Aquabacterium sp.]|nr:glycosyltransferase family 87 protein [Aquabacterium sp.]
MMTHISFRNLLAWCGALLALLLIGTYYVDAGQKTTAYPPSSDFYKFYLSGERLTQNKSIYWIIPPRIQPGDPCHPDALKEAPHRLAGISGDMILGGSLPCLAPNLNPPIFMALVAPISQLPFVTAWWVWAGFSTACALYSMWLIAGVWTTSRPQHTLHALWASAALLAYYPSYVNFTLGQVGTILMLPLVLAWLAMRKNHLLKAGMWLGVATSLKPFLGLFLLILLITKQWRTSTAFMASILTFALIGLLWMGWDIHQQYMLVAGHVTWTTSNWNGSLVGFFDRAFSGTAQSGLPETRILSKALAIFSSLSLLLIMTRILNKYLTSNCQRYADILFMLCIPASVLISPLGWLYYLPWLALSGAVAWQFSANLSNGRAMRLALFASLLATIIPIEMKSIPTMKNPTTWYGIDALYAYVLLGFFVTTCLIAMAQQKNRIN